jgi:phosphodiesterase/alkaline phosphatase D-like protein
MRGKGEAVAAPDADWTVKVLLSGLNPGTVYYYRFRAGDAYSPVGRTKTLPTGALEKAVFAVVSCTNYPFGYFNVYDQVARRDDLDAVLHLGDYIYEYGPDSYGGRMGEKLGRPHDPPHEIVTLDDYRRRHAQYKADPSSRAMHAAHPMIAIWDDHETSNDSWKGGAENHDPATEGEWAARKRAALQAYYEWMPVREPEPGREREALFRSFSYGDLLTIAAIETRLMARAKPFEYDEIVPTLKTPEDIARFRDETLLDPSREMLGAAQEQFLADTLAASVMAGQPWRLLANQVIMANVIAPDLNPHVTEEDIVELEREWSQARAFVAFSALGLPINMDAWDGYAAAREKFYELARDAGAKGLLVVTGDTHTWWANDLVARDGAHMGVELGVHSVTSPSPYRKEFLGGKGAEYAQLTNKENKSVRYLSGEHHGYIALEIGRSAAKARFMAVDTIEGPSYNAFEKATISIKKSKDGAKFAGIDGVSLKEKILF